MCTPANPKAIEDPTFLAPAGILIFISALLYCVGLKKRSTEKGNSQVSPSESLPIDDPRTVFAIWALVLGVYLTVASVVCDWMLSRIMTSRYRTWIASQIDFNTSIMSASTILFLGIFCVWLRNERNAQWQLWKNALYTTFKLILASIMSTGLAALFDNRLCLFWIPIIVSFATPLIWDQMKSGWRARNDSGNSDERLCNEDDYAE